MCSLGRWARLLVTCCRRQKLMEDWAWAPSSQAPCSSGPSSFSSLGSALARTGDRALRKRRTTRSGARHPHNKAKGGYEMSSLKSVGIAGVFALFAVAAVAPATLSPAVRIIAPAEAATASKLGDLSSFRTIVVDTAGFVDKGDLPAGTARLKDLVTTLGEGGGSPKARGAR